MIEKKTLPLRYEGAKIKKIKNSASPRLSGSKGFLLFFIFAIALSACASSSSQIVIPTVSLDSPSQSLTSATISGGATAKGTVVPVKKVELSFPLAGLVKNVGVVEGNLVAQGQTLVVLDTAILEARVREAEATVVTQETQVTYLKRTGTTPERLDAARADVARAQATVDSLKAQLAQATLLAPFQGTIASVNISPAEFASAGQIVVVMGDLTRFQIETTDLSEKVAPNVRVGQRVNVFIEALNKDVGGKVIDVARISKTIGGDVVFTVTIELNEQPQGLRWGMSANATIETK